MEVRAAVVVVLRDFSMVVVSVVLDLVSEVASVVVSDVFVRSGAMTFGVLANRDRCRISVWRSVECMMCEPAALSARLPVSPDWTAVGLVG